MLDILLSWFLVYLVINQWLKQALWVIHYTDMNLVLIGNSPVIKVDTLC